ncbi:MBL fold metallo-hydrolase [Nocardioides psychrotolerans]|uniref:Glyoxylase, beta-lactamase superfamily II n=1 Tax=Nocardioides psychrotolerans TaxID=1005945 RepID=A0A1I3QNJ3_9ACTN|nr:MBL fold metallo-hydrolase [Nocardioides psychrotolerans]GEP40168.1 MBL fold metallo-hydrolase [Nocardioides psychrotolerans]SFJ34831.1 Glyoxylase, beta-lactamase superfamily II [Nocardioides psychrotolerans]
MLQVEVIDTSELGDRSYVVHDGSTAVVIDPQRDIDRVQAILEEHGLTVSAVAETHVHNDYVTGGLELARQSGADYLVCADDEVAFDRRPVSDGDVIAYGALEIRVISTPGHTHTHVSYAVSHRDHTDDRAVFTGGSLLYGSVGRTDLLGDEHTDELTRAQFRSARKLVSLLPADTGVYPTHGFGSFCSSGSAAGGDSSTIGEEHQRNDALTEDDEDTFVAKLVANLTAYPAYYAHMAPRNAQGPGPIDLSPPESVDADELRRRVEAGEWVVDLRARKVYATGHLCGSIGIDLEGQFATYLGWLMPWGTHVTLIGETADQVSAAQREMVRIGIERPAGAAAGEVGSLVPAGELADYPVVTFEELRKAQAAPGGSPTVLDVRRDDERAAEAIPGSSHIPIHELLDRLDEVPRETLWVHCLSGYRASICASLLAREGHDVVLIDDAFEKAVELGLTRSGS